VLAGLLVSAGILTSRFVGGGSTPSGRTLTVVRSFDATGLPGVLTGPAPWGANTANVPRRIALMALPPKFGYTVHIHQHLDIFLDGARVVVPSGIGSDPGGAFLAPLHTHDDTGVIHVESQVRRDYTLGEFFGIWGVRFTRRCLGAYCAGGSGRLRVFVDGRRLRSDPGLRRLRQHDEIAIVIGTPVAVPSSYAFPSYD
jgi:hypothetical protein